MVRRGTYDVAVVGGSLAGCAAAMLLARSGLHVALIERRANLDAYKVACTHYIQASATPTIRRLGLDVAIEAAGGVRCALEVRTRWGWIQPPAETFGPGPSHGYSIRRQTLDPLVRRLAVETPGVDALFGRSATGLEHDRDRLHLTLHRGAAEEESVAARVVVGADGRASKVAELARLPRRPSPNGRFAFWAYYRDVTLPVEARARFWHVRPDVAYVIPTDSGLTLIVVMPQLARLPEFKADRVAAFDRLMRDIPEGPALEGARRVSPVLGALNIPNVRRPPVTQRVALVGDAALACDPLPGVGCGWALQSAAWLADELGPAVAADRDPAGALEAYAARHRAETRWHYAMIRSFSLARERRPYYERLLLKAATRDEELAARALAFLQRRVNVPAYLTPSTFIRSTRVLGREAARAR